jgi:uncharacterized protein YbcI
VSGATQEAVVGGDVTSAISDAMASLLNRHTGRGATSSWTTFSRDLIVCVMGNALTKGARFWLGQTSPCGRGPHPTA